MTTGERIRKRREELGMTQKELADKLGYKNHTSIQKIEADEVGIRQSKILDLAEALDMKPIDLLDIPDNFETRAISYQTFLDHSPSMFELNEIIKKNAESSTFIERILEYAKALDLLYDKQSYDEWRKQQNH